MAGGTAWLATWCIRKLIDSKQSEIDRIVMDRDKFQQLVIEHWQSSIVKDKGGKKT